MSLVKVNELLQHATEHHYGVAAMNTINYETIQCAIAAAENERVPSSSSSIPDWTSISR